MTSSRPKADRHKQLHTDKSTITSFMIAWRPGRRPLMDELPGEIPYFAPELRPILRDAWQALAPPRTNNYLILEGTVCYPEKGFPDYDLGQLRRGINRAIKDLLVAGRSKTPAITIRNDCSIEVYVCPPHLFDKIHQSWQIQQVGSPTRGRLVAKAKGNRGRSQESPLTREQTVNDFSSLLQNSSLDDPKQAMRLTNCLNQEIDDALHPTRKNLKLLLKRLEGRPSFDEFKDNREFVNALRDLVYRVNRRLACPDCGEPAILVSATGTGSKRGTFRFQHRTDGVLKSHAASSPFPKQLRLVLPAPDGRRMSS